MGIYNSYLNKIKEGNMATQADIVELVLKMHTKSQAQATFSQIGSLREARLTMLKGMTAENILRHLPTNIKGSKSALQQTTLKVRSNSKKWNKGECLAFEWLAISYSHHHDSPMTHLV